MLQNILIGVIIAFAAYAVVRSLLYFVLSNLEPAQAIKGVIQ